VLADLALYEGDAASALAHYDREGARARERADPFRLLWILYNVTICHDALHAPKAGVLAAEEAIKVAELTANPTARAMARCALGRALKEAEPDRALVLLEQAAELAVSVENNWLIGIASMERAAIRAAHGDPALAAQTFIELLDLWGRGGPGTGSQQWLTLRYVTRLLVRLGADAEAVALHHALVDAGQISPLSAEVAKLVAVEGDLMTGPEAVAFVRLTLQRYL
jgi:hypothetical protein